MLRPCHDDFNNIGAGFGFPVRFKVEVSDDPDFAMAVRRDRRRDRGGFPQPRPAAVRAKAGGKAGRYVRVTATKLAPRQNDFMLALAELEVLDAEGKNLAAGKAGDGARQHRGARPLAEVEPDRRHLSAGPETRRRAS